ncbi:reticulon-1-A-like isoform X1 [Euwallacea similis]|uniref:reticulon-1-A-like isoform X1 n=1 Tax=Euwallacea similis TaxID=1736056 RepID=UPI00344C5218
MAEDLQKVANEIVDNVIDGVETELKTAPASGSLQTNIVDSSQAEEPAKKSVLCSMICPNVWFNKKLLNPKVENLIYWRDPKQSAPIFAGVLIILLALTYFSLISVIAYLSLFTLIGTTAFRIYKNIIQAIQKTGDGHPFKEYLDVDVALPQEKVQDFCRVATAHLNAALVELRRLFLVEDLVDSVKFGVLLWVLTYLGSWFNGMSLVIIAWAALFTLPKIYQANQAQIDANLEIVRVKIAEITEKVKAAVPIGKKGEKLE